MQLLSVRILPLARDFFATHENDGRIIAKIHCKHPAPHGVAREVFDHVLLFLSAMNCWTPSEVEGPWQTNVKYTVGNGDITEPVAGDGVEVSITTDERGDTPGLLVTTVHKETTVRLSDHLFVTIQLVTHDQTKRQLSKGASFSNIVVRRSRTYTYTSTFSWTYTLALDWTCPGVKHVESEEETRGIYFCNPPSYHVVVECQPPLKCRDPSYLTKSIICKLTELVHPYIYSTANTTDSTAGDGVVGEVADDDV
jgi:hypothetical protein